MKTNDFLTSEMDFQTRSARISKLDKIRKKKCEERAKSDNRRFLKNGKRTSSNCLKGKYGCGKLNKQTLNFMYFKKIVAL